MKESEGIRELAEQLRDRYGEDAVLREPAVEAGRFRPDIVVYTDETRSQPLLVVEYKRSLSYRRRDQAFEQLDQYITALGCKYGAIVTPSLQYIFRREGGNRVERSLGDFPGPEVPPAPKRIDTPEEVQFLINRVADLHWSSLEYEAWLSATFQILLQKHTADEMGLDAPLDDPTGFEQFLNEIDRELISKYEAYRPVEYDEYYEFARDVFRVFDGYTLSELPQNVAEQFYQTESLGSSELDRYQTLSSVSGSIVSLAEINDGMTVLDPAAGIGRVVREAAEEGADAYAIEKQQDAVNVGLFLSEVVDNAVDYVCADFFELFSKVLAGQDFDRELSLSDFGSSENHVSPEELNSDLPGPGVYDRILLDPPTGSRVPTDYVRYETGQKRSVRIEAAFIANALELLEPDGTLVAIVPETILAGEQTRHFRDYLINKFSLEVIITFEASVYSGSEAKAGLVRIRNRGPKHQQPVATSTVEDHSGRDLNERLRIAVDRALSADADVMYIDRHSDRTLLPKQVFGQTEVTGEIQDRYGGVSSLEEVALEVVGGVSRPREGEVATDKDMVPFLSPIDLEDEEPTPPTVSKENARVTANPTDLLIRVKGEPLVVYRPEVEVVPSSDWAVARFSSEAEAKAYQDYFETDIAEKSISANRRGSIVPYITISALQDLPVPVRDAMVGDSA